MLHGSEQRFVPPPWCPLVVPADRLPCTTVGSNDAVVSDFNDALVRRPDMAVAVAAIRALTGVIRNSHAQVCPGASTSRP